MSGGGQHSAAIVKTGSTGFAVSIKDRWIGILCLIFTLSVQKIEFQRQILCALLLLISEGK